MMPNDDLLTLIAPCAWCGTMRVRQIEPEWAAVVAQHGICDRCYEAQEQARGMGL